MKKLLILIPFLALVAWLVCTATAQDATTTTPAPDLNPPTLSPAAMDGATSFVASLAKAHPWIATVMAIMAGCRVLLKPTFTYLHEVVKVTPSQWDDDMLAKIEASTALRWVSWALDFFFSIKLVHPDAGKA